MYPNDQQYNNYYNNENNGYNNGYQAPYGQYNVPYSQPEPEPQPETPAKKSFFSGKAIALVLACAVAGGAAGVGSAAAYLRANTNTTVIMNQSGVELPETGGVGTTMIYIIGGILFTAALVLLVTKKRMTNEA